MSNVIRILSLAALLGALSSIPASAQHITAYPTSISFVATAYTPLPLDRPPRKLVELGPVPADVGKAPFQASIRPTNLPSGVATNFVIVSPSSGIAATERSGVARVVPSIALNPKVVPYMRHGLYHLWVVFENPERPELGTGAVGVTLLLKSPGFPVVESVVNAASLLPGISPGQVVSVFGKNLSTPPVTAEADSLGRFPTVIGNTRVTFDGTAAPLLYVSNERIDCVVPQAVAGRSAVDVVVDLLSPADIRDSSPTFAVPIADTSPAIYTVDQSGAGPGAISNFDPDTGPNTESNPAPRKSIILFSATGAGAWNSPYPDGCLILSAGLGYPPPSPTYLAPLAPVSLTIGGQPAKVAYATAQRMRVLGILEVIAEIPEGIESGPQPIVLKIGDNDNAQQNVTVWVQ